MEQSRRKPLSERLEHNRIVEQARMAHHQRRCEESPIYKRVYEKMQQVDANNAELQRTLFNLMQPNAMHQPLRDFAAEAKKAESQPLRSTTFQDMHPLVGIPTDNGWAYAIIAIMFADKEYISRMKEELPFAKEYMDTENYYRNQLEPISGWEV